MTMKLENEGWNIILYEWIWKWWNDILMKGKDV